MVLLSKELHDKSIFFNFKNRSRHSPKTYTDVIVNPFPPSVPYSVSVFKFLKFVANLHRIFTPSSVKFKFCDKSSNFKFIATCDSAKSCIQLLSKLLFMITNSLSSRKLHSIITFKVYSEKLCFMP